MEPRDEADRMAAVSAEEDSVGVADPTIVPAPAAAGGIGGTPDGTQVSHHSPTAVPGKPMATIADDPAGSSTLEGQAMDTPTSAPHSERGGSG